MKLAFVIQKLAGRGGGAERVLVETANEMARRGHQVEILTYENRGVAPFYSVQAGVTLRNLFDRPIAQKDKERWQKREQLREKIPFVFPLGHIRWHMTHAGFVRALRSYIRKNEPDALIPFLPPAITPCALAARKTGVRVIASTHNEPSQDYANLDRWDPNPIDVRLRLRVLKYIDRILVLLPEYKDWYPRELQDKINGMPNPVEIVDNKKLNWSKREKVILGVGRLADVKRFDVLIEAWNEIYDQFPDWRVEIYGEGPNRKQLEGLIRSYALEDSLRLMGTTNKMSDQYLRASVLCHPAKYEGFPLAVSEALAHGLPVVGFSDCSGLNSLVVNDKTGVLVNSKQKRSRSLAVALSLLMRNSNRLERMSEAAPASVAKYAPNDVYDLWEATIENTVYREQYNY